MVRNLRSGEGGGERREKERKAILSPFPLGRPDTQVSMVQCVTYADGELNLPRRRDDLDPRDLGR